MRDTDHDEASGALLLGDGTQPPLFGGGPSQRIQSVDRAVALLQAIASSPHPPSVLELAVACRLNRTTAWRLLATLQYHGVLGRDPMTQGYVIGHEITRLALSTDHEPLVRLARPVLERHVAGLGETLTLAVPGQAELVYVDQVDPPGISRPSWVGKPLALHATSTGKVFLASISKTELEAILPEPLDRFTDHTITDRDALMAELARTSSRGYGTCDREYEEYSNGVAAPVRGYSERPIAIAAVWAPAQRLTAEQFRDYGETMTTVANEIAALLAGPSRQTALTPP